MCVGFEAFLATAKVFADSIMLTEQFIDVNWSRIYILAWSHHVFVIFASILVYPRGFNGSYPKG